MTVSQAAIKLIAFYINGGKIKIISPPNFCESLKFSIFFRLNQRMDTFMLI